MGESWRARRAGRPAARPWGLSSVRSCRRTRPARMARAAARRSGPRGSGARRRGRARPARAIHARPRLAHDDLLRRQAASVVAGLALLAGPAGSGARRCTGCDRAAGGADRRRSRRMAATRRRPAARDRARSGGRGTAVSPRALAPARTPWEGSPDAGGRGGRTDAAGAIDSASPREGRNNGDDSARTGRPGDDHHAGRQHDRPLLARRGAGQAAPFALTAYPSSRRASSTAAGRPICCEPSTGSRAW